MVINSCKHDGGFMLNYNMITHNYCFSCVRCQVFKLPFNPAIYPEGVAYPDKYVCTETVLETNSLDSGKSYVTRVSFKEK